MAAAWELVRTEGLAGLTMRDLGDRVGMRAGQAPSTKFALFRRPSGPGTISGADGGNP